MNVQMILEWNSFVTFTNAASDFCLSVTLDAAIGLI